MAGPVLDDGAVVPPVPFGPLGPLDGALPPALSVSTKPTRSRPQPAAKTNNPANAAALSAEVQVWLIPSAIITQVLTQNSQVALNVIRLLAKRVRSLVGQIEDLALYSVIVRLARFLIKQIDDPGLSGPGVTRTVIAAHLNTTPQTISVALRELEATGAIEFDRHQIIIIDEAQLRTIALL